MTDSAPVPLEDFRAEISKIHERLDAQDQAISANTETTSRVEANTSELIEVMNALKGAFRVFNAIAAAAKPLAYIATAVTAVIGLITAFKTGQKLP